MNEQELKICRTAIHTWGVDAQLDMMIEEMAELTKAIIKHRRDKVTETELLREGVDVQIMMMQLESMFVAEDWLKEHNFKMLRLETMLPKEEGEHHPNLR